MLRAMISFFKRDRPSRLRAFRTYLITILGGTFVLFSLGLVSLVRQQDTVRELSISNLRFAGERIAYDVENKVQRLAEDCLRSNQLESLPRLVGDACSVETTRLAHQKLAELKKAHPVARHFFVFSESSIVYPRVSSPGTQTLDSLLSGRRSTTVNQFEYFLKDGADKDLRRHQPELAAASYRRAAELAFPDRLKALAIYYAWRALLKSGDTAAAIETGRQLLLSYGDQCDLSQTPYALSLALEPERVVGGIFKSYPLSRVYQDLLNGRWDLSADQAEYFLSRLEERLGAQKESRPSTDFLERLALARALRAGFRIDWTLPPREIIARQVQLKDQVYQTFCTILPDGNGHRVLAGFSVSLPWIQDTLLPESLSEAISSGGSISAFVEPASATPDGNNGNQDIFVSFKTVLPFWQLRLPTSVIQVSEAAANRELLFAGLSAGMFLSILSLGVYLLVRVSRDLQWFQLQSNFVSGITHELKTPLSLIRLYSETLADGEQAFPPEDRHNYIRIIARESERLSRLIDNVLDFSKIEQGRSRSSLQEGNLAETVSQTVDDYSEYLALRGFTVKKGIQPDLPTVRFNREQISQTVLNLMDNARKYSDKSRLIRIHMWLQDPEIVLEVQDYGLGIAHTEREKIFEPFYRVPGASEKGGCGLGLYLVQNVMRSHGGRVELDSEVGKGSRFRLFFPISAAAKSGRASAEAAHEMVAFLCALCVSAVNFGLHICTKF